MGSERSSVLKQDCDRFTLELPGLEPAPENRSHPPAASSYAQASGKTPTSEVAALVPLQLIGQTSKTSSEIQVSCDWLSFRHRYEQEVPAVEAGRTIKVDRDGAIEWESRSWDTVRCPSSDTSLRIRCDGKTLQGSANIGRFQRPDNIQGLGVVECIERWAEVLKVLGYDLTGFGSRWREGTVGEWGTYITRIDLAGNWETDDYAALCHAAMVRRIGQKLPQMGRFGPMWGYDAKRSNWTKAKLYDKTAEQAGKRRSDGGATLARFEVQLGQEWLKREGFDQVGKWGDDMAEVIYGKFADQVLRESLSVEDWMEIPPRLRAYAILWRDGIDVRTQFKQGSGGFYRVARKLRDYGIDIATPCNVVALVRRSREVMVRQVNARRAA